MSNVTSRNQTRNQVTFDYDFSKLFLWDNKYRKVNIVATGADLALKGGMLIGAVGATYQVYKSGTANISVVGVLAEDDFTIANGSNADVQVCIGGRVNSSLLLLDGTDTLATVVSNRTIQDRITGESMGIEIALNDELTKLDN